MSPPKAATSSRPSSAAARCSGSGAKECQKLYRRGAGFCRWRIRHARWGRRQILRIHISALCFQQLRSCQKNVRELSKKIQDSCDAFGEDVTNAKRNGFVTGLFTGIVNPKPNENKKNKAKDGDRGKTRRDNSLQPARRKVRG